MNYIITEELVNATIQYMASKPYADVFQLLPMLQSLPVEESVPAKKK